MMRRFPVTFALASGLALSAAAQIPVAHAPAAPAKVAIIAFQMAVGQTNEGLRDFAALQQKYQPKENQFRVRGNEIDGLNKQLQTQAASLTQAQRAARTADIEKKRKQLEAEVQAARKSFQQEAQDQYETLAPKVYDVLNEYVRQHGYTLVLDIAQQGTPVLYASASSNITRQVIDAYNLKSGIPAPPAAPAATSTPHARAPGAH